MSGRPRTFAPEVSEARRRELSTRKRIKDRILADVFRVTHPRQYQLESDLIDALLDERRGPIPGEEGL